MIGGLGVDILPLVPHAVAAGDHVRVGLEDAPFGSPRANRHWVESAVRAVDAAGGRPASAAEVAECARADRLGTRPSAGCL